MIGYFAGALAAGAATFAGLHTMVPWSQLYGRNFTGLDPGSKTLALTYDDGPNDPWTLTLLEVLEKQHVAATFFMLGRYVREHPAVAPGVGGDHEDDRRGHGRAAGALSSAIWRPPAGDLRRSAGAEDGPRDVAC